MRIVVAFEAVFLFHLPNFIGVSPTRPQSQKLLLKVLVLDRRLFSVIVISNRQGLLPCTLNVNLLLTPVSKIKK